jgi:cholesterol transport system auxiliary component
MKAVLCVSICLLTGCLNRPHLDKQSFLIASPSIATPKPASGSRILGIRSLQVAGPFEGRSFVYRTGEYSYEHDAYSEFMVHPADELVMPISSWFREAGGFNAVVESGSALKPNTLVEIKVARLYGDFRPAADPAAILDMRFVFFDAPAGIPEKVILQHEYSRSIPLKTRTPAALVEGWSLALVQILDSAMQDFERVDMNVPNL